MSTCSEHLAQHGYPKPCLGVLGGADDKVDGADVAQDCSHEVEQCTSEYLQREKERNGERERGLGRSLFFFQGISAECFIKCFKAD